MASLMTSLGVDRLTAEEQLRLVGEILDSLAERPEPTLTEAQRTELARRLAALDAGTVTVSPWADVAKSAESLGDRYVFSWKPNPAVMADPAWNPGGIRRDIRDFLERTRGCVTQIVMKDVHTCAHDPRRLGEWVRIAREEVAREVDAHG